MPEPRKAWVAVVEDRGFALGVAVENEPGYYVTDYPTVDTFEKAEKWAATLNAKLGLSEEDAIRIVASSMRAQREHRRGRRGRGEPIEPMLGTTYGNPGKKWSRQDPRRAGKHVPRILRGWLGPQQRLGYRLVAAVPGKAYRWETKPAGWGFGPHRIEAYLTTTRRKILGVYPFWEVKVLAPAAGGQFMLASTSYFRTEGDMIRALREHADAPFASKLAILDEEVKRLFAAARAVPAAENPRERWSPRSWIWLQEREREAWDEDRLVRLVRDHEDSGDPAVFLSAPAVRALAEEYERSLPRRPGPWIWLNKDEKEGVDAYGAVRLVRDHDDSGDPAVFLSKRTERALRALKRPERARGNPETAAVTGPNSKAMTEARAADVEVTRALDLAALWADLDDAERAALLAGLDIPKSEAAKRAWADWGELPARTRALVADGIDRVVETEEATARPNPDECIAEAVAAFEEMPLFSSEVAKLEKRWKTDKIGVGPVGRSRDSELMEQSNWDAISKDLRKRFSGNVHVEALSHWGVGWVEALVWPAERRGRPTKVAEAACDWAEKLDRYPLADEDDYAEKERAAALDAIDTIIGRKVPEARKAEAVEDVYYWLNEHAEEELLNIDDRGAWPSDESVKRALAALGYVEAVPAGNPARRRRATRARANWLPQEEVAKYDAEGAWDSWAQCEQVLDMIAALEDILGIPEDKAGDIVSDALCTGQPLGGWFWPLERHSSPEEVERLRKALDAEADGKWHEHRPGRWRRRMVDPGGSCDVITVRVVKVPEGFQWMYHDMTWNEVVGGTEPTLEGAMNRGEGMADQASYPGPGRPEKTLWSWAEEAVADEHEDEDDDEEEEENPPKRRVWAEIAREAAQEAARANPATRWHLNHPRSVLA